MTAWSTRSALVLGTVLLVVACGSDTPRGSGTAKTEVRNVGEFTAVELQGAVSLDIRIGSPGSFEVTADDDLLGDIETKVSKGTLVVDASGFEAVTPVRVVATVAALKGIKATGASTVTGTALGSTDKLHLEITGAGTMTVSGDARKDLEIDIEGAGRVVATGLPVESVDVAITGTGIVAVDAVKSLKARVKGAGVVTYVGQPQVDAKVEGGGEVRPGP